MFDKLIDKLLSKKKSGNENFHEEETNYENENYEEEGFGYQEKLSTNEFNDAGIEYGDGEEFEEESNYQEVSENEEPKKNKLLFWALIGFLLLLIIIMLCLRSCYVTNGKLTDITIDVPDIIYLDSNTAVQAIAKGKGNLRNTQYKFEVSNEGIVELLAKGYLQGKKVDDDLIPLTTGDFVVSVTAKLEDVKLAKKEKTITICRRLKEDTFGTKDINIVLKKQTKINIDLGTSDACYKNLTYSIKDGTIASVDENGYLYGKKEGETTITITSGDNSITKVLRVISSENLVKVTGITVDKKDVSIYVGNTDQIKATLLPTNATNKNIKWVSSNIGIATVTNTGKITGIGQGSTIITATSEDGEYKALITVSVIKKKISSSGNTSDGTTKPNTNTPTTSDKTAPSLASIKLTSDTKTRYAKLGSIITLSVVANEKLGTKPVMYIAGTPVFVTCTNDTNCEGRLKVTSTTSEGTASIKVYGYKDKAGNTGTVITSTSDASSIMIDRTSPNCTNDVVVETNTASTVKFMWDDSLTGVNSVVKPNGTTAKNNCSTDFNNENFEFIKETNSKIYQMKVTDCAGNEKICSYQSLGTNSSNTSKTLTVSFETNTGVSSIGKTSTSCTTTGTSCSVTLPSITAKSGYSVIGWNATKSATTLQYSAGETITITKNITLYAIVKSTASSNPSTTDTTDPTVSITSVNGGDGIATIKFTLRDNVGVTGYKVTTSSTTPSSWTNITSTTSTSKTSSQSSAATYYVHVKDASGNTSYDYVKLTKQRNSSCNCETAKTCTNSCCGTNNSDYGRYDSVAECRIACDGTCTDIDTIKKYFCGTVAYTNESKCKQSCAYTCSSSNSIVYTCRTTTNKTCTIESCCGCKTYENCWLDE